MAKTRSLHAILFTLLTPSLQISVSIIHYFIIFSDTQRSVMLVVIPVTVVDVVVQQLSLPEQADILFPPQYLKGKLSSI